MEIETETTVTPLESIILMINAYCSHLLDGKKAKRVMMQQIEAIYVRQLSTVYSTVIKIFSTPQFSVIMAI